MSSAAERLFGIMQKSGTDTVSNLTTLIVTSTNPLELSDGDRIILTKDFVVFPSNIDESKIEIGDKFSALSVNANQIYYVVDVISSNAEINTQLQDIVDLKTAIVELESQISDLQDRVTALENLHT